MMFKNQNEIENEEPFEMTAMVDVVFILLTFFIVSAQFMGNEHDVTMQHQSSSPARGLVAEDLPPAIVITLSNLDPQTVGINIGQRQLLPNGYTQITKILTQINLPQLPVMLQVDGDVIIQNVTHAIEAIMASPMKKITLTPPEVVSVSKSTISAESSGNFLRGHDF